MKPVIDSNYLGVAVLIAVLFGFSNSAPTAELNPLRPADTSSPRATLQNFIAGTDAGYLRMKELLTSYSRSDRLYLNSAERRAQADIIPSASKAIQSLDVSDVLPVLRKTVSVERAIQLKEILDRIELSSFDDIPDREAANPGRNLLIPTDRK